MPDQRTGAKIARCLQNHGIPPHKMYDLMYRFAGNRQALQEALILLAQSTPRCFILPDLLHLYCATAGAHKRSTLEFILANKGIPFEVRGLI